MNNSIGVHACILRLDLHVLNPDTGTTHRPYVCFTLCFIAQEIFIELPPFVGRPSFSHSKRQCSVDLNLRPTLSLSPSLMNTECVRTYLRGVAPTFTTTGYTPQALRFAQTVGYHEIHLEEREKQGSTDGGKRYYTPWSDP